MNAYDDDNGASLVPQDDKWPAEKAAVVMFAAGLACWAVIGGLVWWAL